MARSNVQSVAGAAGPPTGPLLVAIANRHRRALCVIAILALAESAMVLASPWPLALTVDNAIGHRPFPSWLSALDSLGTFGRTCLAIVVSIAIVAVATLLSYALTIRATRTSEKIGAELRASLMSRLMDLGVGFHERHHSGDLANRVTSDVSRVEDAVVSISSTVMPELMTLIGIVVIMTTIDPVLAGAAALVVPASWLVTTRRRRAVRAAERASRDESGELAARSIEFIRNATIIQTFSRQRSMLHRYGHQNRRAMDAGIHAAAVEARYRPISDLLVALVGGLCVALGVAGVSRGAMTVGTLLVLLAYMNRIFSPVRSLSSLATSLAKVSASRDRLLEVLNAEAELPADGDLRAPEDPAEVAFHHVYFGYREGEPVLRDVTITIPPRAFVAVVGRSGAGKTTLLNLLRRCYDPDSGSVTIAGLPLAGYDLHSLREHTAYVPQDSTLLDGTIAENIAFGREGATFYEVREAAASAMADDFIRDLPNGYDTILGEGGAGISGGQRRRIALARAVVRDGPLLLLDEPTSGLDATSEAAVLEALRSIASYRTVVAVSHHFALAACADLVVVLDDGVVTEVGPPTALMAADGPFKRLWASSKGPNDQEANTRGRDTDGQSQRLLRPLRGRREVQQVEQVQEDQVQQVEQVPQVRPLTGGLRGGRGDAASPSRSRRTVAE